MGFLCNVLLEWSGILYSAYSFFCSSCKYILKCLLEAVIFLNPTGYIYLNMDLPSASPEQVTAPEIDFQDEHLSLFMNVSPACAGGHSSHSEVLTTSAHRCCPCLALTMWILQGIVPPGTLGTSVGFVLLSGLYCQPSSCCVEWRQCPSLVCPKDPLWFHCMWDCAGAAEMSLCSWVHWWSESCQYPVYRVSLFWGC